MKSLSDTNKEKPTTSFDSAVTWTMPEVSGQTIKKKIKPEKKTSLDDVRSFESRIKKQIDDIKKQKDNPTYLTVSQLQDIQKQAHDEAYKKGYDEAYKKGTADSDQFIQKELSQQRAELKQKATQLQQCFNVLSRPLNDVDDAVEQQLTEMVFSLTKQIISHEISISSEHITGVLQQAISRLPMAQRQVLIKMNSADIKLLQDNDINIEDPDWKLDADDSIAAGGCLIETESVRIDRRIDTRMKELSQQLFDGLAFPENAAELNASEVNDNSQDKGSGSSSGLEITDE